MGLNREMESTSGLEKYSDPKNYKLLIAAPQVLPNDQKEAANRIGWVEDFDSNTKIISRSGDPVSEIFSNKVKFEIPFALLVAAQALLSKPDVILAHNEAVGLPLSVLNRLGLLGKCKLAIYSHSPLSDGPKGIKKFLTQFGDWDMMICQTEEERQGLINKYNLPEEKVASCMLPYNVADFTPQSEQVKLEDPYILSIGVSKRDYPTLIQAMRHLGKRVPNLLIDPNSPSDPLKDADWKKDLPENIKLTRYENPSIHNNAVERALYVVLAIEPETPQKTAGCTLVQAGASAGIPTVAATNGLTEYILNGQTGIIVEPGSPKVLAEAIDEMANNHELRRKMGKESREFAETTFTPEATTKRLRNILRSTVQF